MLYFHAFYFPPKIKIISMLLIGIKRQFKTFYVHFFKWFESDCVKEAELQAPIFLTCSAVLPRKSPRLFIQSFLQAV